MVEESDSFLGGIRELRRTAMRARYPVMAQRLLAVINAVEAETHRDDGLLAPNELAGLRGVLGEQIDEATVVGYFYALLVSKPYRKQPVELRSLPMTADAALFDHMSRSGLILMGYHTFEPAFLPPRLEGDGERVVRRARYEQATGRLYLNREVFVAPIDVGAYRYELDGVRPARQWLSENRGPLDDASIEALVGLLGVLNESAHMQREIDDLAAEIRDNPRLRG